MPPPRPSWFRWLPMLLGLAACAPTTAGRRGALVPTPSGDSLIHPQGRVAELAGSVAHTDGTTDPTPSTTAPALQAARTVFLGHARFRFGKYMRLGAQGFFAHGAFASPTTAGTPPMDRARVWGLGPQISFHFRDRRWAFGGGFAFTFASVPWTSWRRREDAPTPTGELPEATLEHYERDESGRQMKPMLAVGVGATWIVGPALEAFVGLSLQSYLANVGFDEQPRGGATLSADHVGMAPLVGLTLRVPGTGLYFRGQYYYPLAFGDLARGPAWGGVMGTLGVELGENPDDPLGLSR